MNIKGAEASIKIDEDDVIKERVEKNYRHPELDKRIIKERTKEEAKNTKRARKYSVKVPEVKEVKEDTIVFEKIDGEVWKKKESIEKMEELGENVALMHENKVIHGDLTTSNVMIRDSGEIRIIDFGLSFISERVEDQAVDIHLLKQVLDSSHPDKAKKAWKKFLEGYRENERYAKVLERFEEVQSRGRYK